MGGNCTKPTGHAPGADGVAVPGDAKAAPAGGAAAAGSAAGAPPTTPKGRGAAGSDEGTGGKTGRPMRLATLHLLPPPHLTRAHAHLRSHNT